jgi:hypothetical protein
MSASTPEVITRYFAAQASRDFGSLVPLFTANASSVDLRYRFSIHGDRITRLEISP